MISHLEHFPVLGLPPALLVVVHEALHAGPQLRVAPAQSEQPEGHDARVLGRHAAHPGISLPETTTFVTMTIKYVQDGPSGHGLSNVDIELEVALDS